MKETDPNGVLSHEALGLLGQLVAMALQVPDESMVTTFASAEGWRCSTRECSLIAELATRNALAPKILFYVAGQFVLCSAPPITLSPQPFPVWRP